jgi:hypothetical protein
VCEVANYGGGDASSKSVGSNTSGEDGGRSSIRPGEVQKSAPPATMEKWPAGGELTVMDTETSNGIGVDFGDNPGALFSKRCVGWIFQQDTLQGQ